MAKISIYNLKGKKVKELELSSDVFAVPENQDLLQQVYVSMAANKRVFTAHTKDKGERKGSGRKPWKQKGTGNARTGSIRNPIWRKGGVIFGPTSDRNFKKKINIKMNKKAITIALSEKVRNKNLVVVDEVKLASKKTNEFFQALNNLKISGSILIGFSEKERDFRIASRNIDNVDNILTSNLNVFDILNHKNLILSVNSVKHIEDKYKK